MCKKNTSTQNNNNHTFEINSSQHVNFSLETDKTKPYDIEKMTGKSNNSQNNNRQG